MTTQPSPVNFDWTASLLVRLIDGIDWLVHQQVVMVILVVAVFIGLIQYAMG